VSKRLVRDFYTRYGAGEWRRLVQDPYHRLEFDTTVHFLKKYLPMKGLILDAGGGPGRYTVELARLGYEVVLLDLSPRMLEIARREIRKAGIGARVKETLVGSIDSFPAFADNSFDAVLCLGAPLSHLVKRSQRNKAISELVRVARKGAPICVSVLGRMALCANTINYLWSEMVSCPEVFWKYVLTGDYYGGCGFTAAHFYLPEELARDFSGRMDVLALVGLEGVFSTHRNRYNKVHRTGKYNRVLWDLHLTTCTHPVSAGISEHLMIIGRKRQAGRTRVPVAPGRARERAARGSPV
jgi:SAM-dependent methyltransferase